MTRAHLLLGAIVGLALCNAACKSDPYCLSCEETDGAYVGPGADLQSADLVVPPDLGPCDPSKLDTDPNHCGSCENACPRAHAVPTCEAGACKITCDVGWIDLDGQLANDCEYACLATGAESCDGADNDCNGTVDDGFDLMTDPLNCGTCGNACSVVNGVGTCVAGACQVAGCLSGYRDNDAMVPGCEYKCPVFPPLAFESCNGLDDDCDGSVDEAMDLEAAPVGLCNTLAGSPCAGTTATCQTRNSITTWYCNYGAGVEFDPTLPDGIALAEAKCDGADGDCNGQIDDTFGGLGATCDNGLKGACRDVGVVSCDPMDATKTRCDLSVLPDAVPGAPLVETCNGQDDDCDGTADNYLLASGPTRLVQDMVHVTDNGLDFYIDRYEASRPDANNLTAGTLTARSCSKPDALPWTQVPFAVASAACAGGGLRLCTAAEWTAACAGPAASPRTYPYGNAYQGMTCNGADYAAVHAATKTGEAALCLTPGGVFDLSGNVKEWTNDQQGMTTETIPQPIYVTRGGAYGSPSLGLTCATTFSQAAANASLTDLGFRCCKSTAP